MTYQLRYMFDVGSGVCLWAENTKARDTFGYAIEHWELSLSENAKRYLDYLIAWFDTSIDWDHPARISPQWSLQQQIFFKEATETGLRMLQHELGHSFEIISDL